MESVKQQYNEFKEKGHTRGFRGHDNDRDGRPTSRGRHEGRHNRDRRHDRNEPRDQYANGNGYGGYGYGYQGYGGQQSASMMAPTSQAPSAMPAGTDLNNFDWAAYAASCVGQWGYDPYSDFGGAEAYLRYYYTVLPYGYSGSTVGQDHTDPSTYSGAAPPPSGYAPAAGTAPPPPAGPTDEAFPPPPPPPPESFPPPPPPGV